MVDKQNKKAEVANDSNIRKKRRLRRGAGKDVRSKGISGTSDYRRNSASVS